MQTHNFHKNRKKKHILSFRRLIQIVCVLAFVFSAISIIRYQLMTASQKKLQQELRQEYRQAEEKQEETQENNAEDSKEQGESDIRRAKLPEVVFSSAPNTPVPLGMQARATLVPTAPVQKVEHTPEPAMHEKFVSLYRANSDVKGWLKLDSVSSVDFPIVHKDNDFYLHRDFYWRKNAGGTAFLDESCSIIPKSENLIIHAHNMKNGTMFGKLYTLMKPEVFKQAPLANFDTLYENGVYVPYAVSVVSLRYEDAHFTSIYDVDFSGNQEKGDYIENLRNLSVYNIPVDVTSEDELLTLITCHGHEDRERLVVAYRKLRDSEDPEEIKKHISTHVTLSSRR